MDDSSVKAKNSANIHCWNIHGGDNQRFKLEKCEDKPMSNKPSEAEKEAIKPSSHKPAEAKKSA